MATVVVSQSNYLPWKGYFDMIQGADHLVLLENVQFTRRDWRSRNKIKVPSGVQWLSVPVRTPKGRETSVAEAEIADIKFYQPHLKAIELSYARTPHFQKIYGLLSDCMEHGDLTLSLLNERILRTLCHFMSIRARISSSRGSTEQMDPSERILNIVKAAGGKRYISGPAARNYLNMEMFEQAGIAVEFFAYPDYVEYNQVWPPFRHDVSIIDVLFHLGEDWRAALQSHV